MVPEIIPSSLSCLVDDLYYTDENAFLGTNEITLVCKLHNQFRFYTTITIQLVLCLSYDKGDLRGISQV